MRSSSTDIGQGAITIFTQIAAAALGVDRRAGRRRRSVDRAGARQRPDGRERTCMVVGGVVERAARALRARIEAWAARAGAPATVVELARRATAAGRRARRDRASTSRRPASQWDDATYTGSAYPVYGWAACLVDVAVDLDTYEVTIERCVQAVDVGKAINPSIVKGQIEGGTLQALGWALLENVVYKDGKVANANMTELHRADVRRRARARDDPRRGAVPVRPAAAPRASARSRWTARRPRWPTRSRTRSACAFDSLPILPEAVARAPAARGALS